MGLRWPRLTILGRSLLLITVLILFNVGCWVAAALLFKPHATGDSSGLMGLALLSWTIGLRHALDADHISAIDNATRGLLNLGQLPTTCGLFFSLGHSTIVVVFIVAITISSDVYDKAGGFGKVGGIVGPAVSGSFLFVIGVVNSVILYRIIRDRRRIRRGLEPLRIGHHHASILVRILAPVTKIVDRPWKVSSRMCGLDQLLMRHRCIQLAFFSVWGSIRRPRLHSLPYQHLRNRTSTGSISRQRLSLYFHCFLQPE